MNVKEEIRRAIRDGIYLGIMTEEQEESVIRELFSFLIKKKNFCTFSEKRLVITVSSMIEDLADIYISRNTLKIEPLAAVGYFQVFMDVLEFIAKKHREEVEAKDQENKVFLDDDSTEDESTEDDGELWL